MKTKFLAAAAAIALAVAAPSFANASIIGLTSLADVGATDTIDWGQLSGGFATPQGVTSALGQSATVSADGAFATIDQGFGWTGNFASGEHLIWTNGSAKEITLDFLNPVSAVGAYIQSNSFGAFIAELIGSNGQDLGSFALFGNSNTHVGEALFLGLKSSDGDISQIRFHLNQSVNDSPDFAIGTVSFAPGVSGSAVPEPATWAMMISGFAMAGMALRSRRLVPVKA
jgi:hypothetical protein